MEIKPNNIYLGDAYELIKNIPNKSIDLIVTDPPYLIQNTEAGGHNDFSRGGKKSIQNMNDQLENSNGELTNGIDETILNEFMRVMKVPNIYIWCNGKQIPQYIDFFVNRHGCAFDIIIWFKTNAMPLFNNKYCSDKEYCLYFRNGGYCQPKNYEKAKTVYCQPININDKNDFVHPTIKPLNIVETIIENSTKSKDDIVLDAFLGSGTTALACKHLGLNYIGFEINEKYFGIAQKRLKGENQKGELNLFDIDYD